MTGDKEWMKFNEYFQIYNLSYYQVKKIILVGLYIIYVLGAARVRVLCLKNGNIYIYI